MTGKVSVFLHLLCHTSVIFEDIDLKLCSHIHQPLPSNIIYAFCENFGFEGENFEKEKQNIENVGNFRRFEKF